MLRSWLYRSRATTLPRSAPDATIYLQARRANRERGITGYLHREDGFYVQYVEGPADALAGLERRIRRDWRHAEVRALHRGEIARRRFPGWDMAFTERETSTFRGATGAVIGTAPPEALLAFMDATARDGGAVSVADHLPSRAADDRARRAA